MENKYREMYYESMELMKKIHVRAEEALKYEGEDKQENFEGELMMIYSETLHHINTAPKPLQAFEVESIDGENDKKIMYAYTAEKARYDYINVTGQPRHVYTRTRAIRRPDLDQLENGSFPEIGEETENA